jgi:NitT/TauT family transport system permease protein
MAEMIKTDSPTLGENVRGKVSYYLPTILVAVGFLTLWELAVRILNIQQFLLPKPTDIVARFLEETQLLFSGTGSSLLYQAAGATLWSAFGGFVIGCGSGILLALVTARWTIVSEAAMPFAIAANSVPIIAFAPIMNNWFGITNPASKMAIVAIIVFFPTMINTVRGLTLIDPRQLELMESYAASPFKILRALRIPNALPYIFSALRVASSLSVIGAIVSEFFGGPRATLGVFITQAASAFDFDRAWAAILMAALIGIGSYLAVTLIERRVMPWHVSFRQTE